jgi:hypothetical protein
MLFAAVLSPLLAQSGHGAMFDSWLLLGAKQTWAR